MAYVGSVLRLLLSAPSDLSAEDRALIIATVNNWNVREGEVHGAAVILMAWSEHAAPRWGIGPQDTINEQLVDLADVVLAIFSTRLGSPTSNSPSGTVEEVERAVADGKYVAVLRCNRPVDPAAIDTEQLASLQNFFEEHRQGGLIRSYSDSEGLGRAVDDVLLFAAGRASRDAPAADAGRVRPAKVSADYSSSRSSRRETFRVANQGDLPAFDVTLELTAAEGVDGTPPQVHLPGAPIPILSAGQIMEFSAMSHGGVADLVTVTAHFADERGGEQRTQESTITC